MSGAVRPEEVSPSELDTIEYVMNPAFVNRVDEELEKLRGLLRKKKFIQVTLSLSRIIKEGGWFTSDEKVEWERWTLPLRFTASTELQENIVKQAIQQIITDSQLYSDQVPGGKQGFTLYDASEEKGWTLADLTDLIRNGPPQLFR
jgi:hypothetical protein